MSKTTFKVTGRVISRTTRNGIAGVRVEAWDKDFLINDRVASAVTNERGAFQLEYTRSYFKLLFLDRRPDLFFKVFQHERMVVSTEDSVLWNVETDLNDVLIEGGFLEDDIDSGASADSLTVSGTVRLSSGGILKRQRLAAFRVDLRGVAAHYRVSDIGELDAGGGFHFLAETVSDKRGSYEVTIQEWQGTKPNVVVYAIDRRQVIGRSRIVYSADFGDRRRVSDVDVAVAEPDSRTEYEVLTSALVGFLQKNNTSLKEIALSSDQLRFTAGEQDLDLDHLTIVATADLLAEGEPALTSRELLYAIGRQNIRLRWPVLYRKQDRELRRAIATSVEEKIIRSIPEPEIKQFLQAVHESGTKHVLEENKETPLNAILASALPEQKQQLVFLRTLRRFEGSDFRKFWDDLKDRPEFKEQPQLIEDLLFTQQLFLLSGNQSALVQELKAKTKASSIDDLFTLEKDDWTRLIKATGVPDFIKGENKDEGAERYARQIEGALNAAFPTKRVARMCARISEQDKLGIEKMKTAEAVRKFFADNEKLPDDEKFEITESFLKIDQQLKDDELKSELKRIQRVFQVSPNPEAMSVLLKMNLNSAYAIANTPEKSFIKSYAREFKKAYPNEFDSQAIAFAIHQRASFINAKCEQAAMHLIEYSDVAIPRAVMPSTRASKPEKVAKNAKTRDESADDAVAGFAKTADKSDSAAEFINGPTYALLFGSPDICECQHCNSIHSAAAYFVDLLLFLSRSQINDAKDSLLNVLGKRRPDLVHLPLTCENTNTVIPYIDLANEVMEYYVAKGSLTNFQGHDTGETTSGELRANPQNFNLDAYGKLKDAVYPFTLPYHQPLDVIRTYSDHLKVSRYEVMVAMNSRTDETNGAMAAESLALSEKEYKVLTGRDFAGDPDDTKIEKFFGYESADDLDRLSQVREFLRRSGVAYTDLIEILKTNFINPHRRKLDFLQKLVSFTRFRADEFYAQLKKIEAGLNPANEPDIRNGLNEFNAATKSTLSTAEFADWVAQHIAEFRKVVTLEAPDSKCDLDATSLRTIESIYEKETESEISWSRIHRFIRLWRKLGWTIHDTDLMLAALGETNITSDTISKLESIALLKDATKLAPIELAVFWGNIDTYGPKSLYKKLFLNRAVQEIDKAFEADAWGDYLQDKSLAAADPPRLSEHLPAILAAFRITETEFNSIVSAATGMTKLEDVLSIQNLSTIYRYVVLARALKLPVIDVCSLIDLFGDYPFSIWTDGAAGEPGKFQKGDPAATLRFCRLADAIKEAGFKTAVLQYIFHGTLPLDSKLGLERDKILQTATDIRSAFDSIDELHPEAPKTPLTSAILSAELSLTFLPEIVSTFMGILEGTKPFETTVEGDDKPDVVIPDQNSTAKVEALVIAGTFGTSEEAAAFLAAFAAKYTYIKSSGRLICVGNMSDLERDTLRGLANVNGRFMQAVERIYGAPELFIRANFVGILGLVEPARIEFICDRVGRPTAEIRDEKLVYVYKRFIPRLTTGLRREAIVRCLAPLVGLSERATRSLIGSELNSLITALSVPDDFVRRATILHRAATFILGFELTDTEVNHFITFRSDFDDINFKALKREHWKPIYDYTVLRNAIPQAEGLLTDVFALARRPGPAPSVADLTAALRRATGWDETNLQFVVSTQFKLTVADFRNAIALRRIHEVMKIVSRSGLSAETVAGWGAAETRFDKLYETGQMLKHAVKAKYEDADWLDLAAGLSNTIRKHQQDALVSYLLTRPEIPATDANSLFEYFLIDVQMGACMDTSRIVQANSSVQMFVNRCLLNLEDGVSPSDIDRNRWEWMKNYRVWEANRKVFLYPENWLEPEWRRNRSEFFKELESYLVQNDISNRSVEQAFRNYLTSLNEVANLDVCGLHRENKSDGQLKYLHVFARTNNAPYKFFYRTCNENRKWSAWEKVQLDIRCIEDGDNSGVHLVPVVWKGRLFLFWPEFMEKHSPPETTGTVKQAFNGAISNIQPTKYWEIRLAWSEYVDGKWSPKQLSKEFIEQTQDEDIQAPKDLLFTVGGFDADAYELVITITDRVWNFSRGYFLLADIQSVIRVSPPGKSLISLESDYRYKFSKRTASGKLVLNDNEYLSTTTTHALLTIDSFKWANITTAQPFFFSDPYRTYFVWPTRIPVAEAIRTPPPGSVDPGLEFHTFYHPYSSQFVTTLNEKGLPDLMSSDTTISSRVSTFMDYDPNFGFVKRHDDLANGTYYHENVCFWPYGANSLYNWELFFHAPLYIATRLSKNGKFAEAMKWFHFIFDPTTDADPVAGELETARFWKVPPFRTESPQSLEDWFIKNLSPNPDQENPEHAVIKEWRDHPFDAHLVASNRPLAYMKHVVVKYVENLIAWGDSLFRRDTMESVNEALQIYVIANHILGSRPEFVPKRGVIKAETYATLSDKFDDFGNALIELENIFPYSSEVSAGNSSANNNLLGVGKNYYFCIPSNDKLLKLWDTVADRLFKIRNCQNIEGVERHLALFSPPIDPGALVGAAAQGLSLGDILADLSSPPPIYRFSYLIQKANEFCGEVKALGSTLLSALEKKDAEELGRLRASHETQMLDLMTGIKERGVLAAKANRENLEKARLSAKFRLQHYIDLLGNDSVTVPGTPSVNATLTADSQLPADTQIVKVVTDVDESLVDSDESGVKLISREKAELDKSFEAMVWQGIGTGLEALAGILHLVPDMTVDGKPFGMGVGTIYGGAHLGPATSGLAKVLQIQGSIVANEANLAAKMASYIRREQDWTLQANLAAKEIIQLDKQITSADIQIQVAEKELANHRQQIENSKQVDLFLKDKFTTLELYQWMKEQLFFVYKQSYDLAYEMAKKAEKAYQYETGAETVSFIQPGYWDSATQGLVAGEKLQMAMRQLEKSYLEENRRELELSKSISLFLLDPLALIQLREKGKCNVSLPEELFDFDFQGHYFRRIKSVSLSIPCVAGPYTAVNCSLRLLRNNIRSNTSMNGQYEHNHEEGVWVDDSRFRSSNVPVTSIATSTAQNDAGMFEFNFRDERYLPFEGSGAISEWQIELSTEREFRQFDYSTISDVILHVRYTAREAGGLFKVGAGDYLKRFITNQEGFPDQPLVRAFSMKHEFATDWHRFLHPAVADADQVLSLTLGKERFPFFTRDRKIVVQKLDVLARCTKPETYLKWFELSEIPMETSETYGGLKKATLDGEKVEDLDIAAPISLRLKLERTADFKSLATDPPEVNDLFLIFHYKLE